MNIEKKKEWARNNRTKMRSYRDKYRKNNPKKCKEQQKKHDATKKDRIKKKVRDYTYYHNEKTGFCNDCKKKIKTEFHHLSYEPSIFIEVCRK